MIEILLKELEKIIPCKKEMIPIPVTNDYLCNSSAYFCKYRQKYNDEYKKFVCEYNSRRY